MIHGVEDLNDIEEQLFTIKGWFKTFHPNKLIKIVTILPDYDNLDDMDRKAVREEILKEISSFNPKDYELHSILILEEFYEAISRNQQM